MSNRISAPGRSTTMVAIATAIVGWSLVFASPAAPAKAVGVTAGNIHTCAVTVSGGVMCWGWNRRAHLGDGTLVTRLFPVGVVGLSAGVSQVVAGGHHTCALLLSGGVKCWGANRFGQIGDDTVSRRRLTPVGVVGLTSAAELGLGWAHTCAVTTSGGAKCWGYNADGRLGDDTTTNRHRPTDVVGLTSGVAQIDGARRHTCAVTTAGAAKCWGDNGLGQLGDGTTSERHTPIGVVGLTTGVIQVAAGNLHTCALLATGKVKCWGNNTYGQLGDGTDTDSLVPVDVHGLTGVIQVVAGNAHSCALTMADEVKCWGSNDWGALGNGGYGNEPTPVDVVGLTGGIASIAVGFDSGCAVTLDGEIKCWGDNESGKLGDNTTWTRYRAVFVQGFGGIRTAVSLRSNARRAGVGERVVYTARIRPTPGGGRVTFYDSWWSIPGCRAVHVVNGLARCSTHYTELGRHRIVAYYVGGDVFKASTSDPLIQLVR